MKYKTIITKTPLRISFVGGGTDFIDFYKKNGGEVFSGAINKYMYLFVNRYFDLSKMSFYNLIIHSFSIISVFKYNVLIRSILFLTIYFFLIYPKLSFITFLPFIFITIFTSLIFILSKRENLDEYNNCLENVGNIEVVK